MDFASLRMPWDAQGQHWTLGCLEKSRIISRSGIIGNEDSSGTDDMLFL